MNMDLFMNPVERQRAATYYQQMNDMADERSCKFCQKQITDQDQENNNMTMLQSSDCFHQVHIECLKENAIKKYSENEQV